MPPLLFDLQVHWIDIEDPLTLKIEVSITLYYFDNRQYEKVYDERFDQIRLTFFPKK